MALLIIAVLVWFTDSQIISGFAGRLDAQDEQGLSANVIDTDYLHAGSNVDPTNESDKSIETQSIPEKVNSSKLNEVAFTPKEISELMQKHDEEHKRITSSAFDSDFLELADYERHFTSDYIDENAHRAQKSLEKLFFNDGEKQYPGVSVVNFECLSKLCKIELQITNEEQYDAGRTDMMMDLINNFPMHSRLIFNHQSRTYYLMPYYGNS
ncbi:MAG: hypothetical protein V2I33_03650 [Kangiellaceae bacterium]|nr:hypothetical protein [Kangiellaceae bacterium]